MPRPGVAAKLGAGDYVSYRFVDHTSELELELEAPSRGGVFEDAVLALGELLAGDAGQEGAVRTRELAARAGDDPALLAAWLAEIVFVAETEGLVPRGVERLEVDTSDVRGVVSFAEGTPRHLVKGVTYHDLELVRDGSTWRGRAVLDV
jgi:SHS2 domain-containing protein